MERIGDDTISESLGDEEIPLVEHLSELRRRLVVVLIPFAAVTLLIFPFSNDSLHFLLSNLFHGDMPIFVYSPMEWISVRLTFCFLCALSITIPLLLYEISPLSARISLLFASSNQSTPLLVLPSPALQY